MTDSLTMPPSNTSPDGTRSTLLSRLRDVDDRESWRTFFERYWELLYNVARHAGLNDASAQDVVQETVISVARAMPEFRYDRQRGTFKQWLLRIARRRIADHLRRIYREPLHVDVPESMAENIDDAWETEWQRLVFRRAVEQVKQTANAKHFQVFDYCVLREWAVKRVAQTLAISTAQVYLARHRISRAVKAEAHRICGQWEQEEASAHTTKQQ